ncbi:MAG: ATP-dependent 6-phosphofructokinase [Spirochaetes bacterium]|nr:MAG: ATP-dependent 6-phosphofructokinase [Spirochaetota bacterium]
MLEIQDTQVDRLGECAIDTPLRIPKFIDEGQRIVVDVDYESLRKSIAGNGDTASFENAGPRRKIFFDPANTRAAIVTCGGLCPGINNVIRGIVLELFHQYKVKSIYGVRYGFEGLIPKFGHGFMTLTPEVVENLHIEGGTLLGSSRGNQNIEEMVDTLEANYISILFTIGGDGTLRGTQAIYEEIAKRGLKISIVGVPKTIDNDISYVDRTFGFETAVSTATPVLYSAHAEAKGARNGIGLVKVMGRDSGFIAATTAIASNVVNYVLIPEAPFRLHGPGGFLEHLHHRLVTKKHAVILAAEGAGQEYFEGLNEFDASGNKKKGDIGTYLRDQITGYFKEKNTHINLKYIDPSYIIRSVPASPDDAVFCIMLAQNAVHGAMSGRSGFLVGRWNKFFTFIPLKLATKTRKKVDPKGYLWSIVKETTGQEDFT